MGKGKPTKRERKFQASGGVKGRIQKGTITKKGKLKKRKKASQSHPPNKSSTSSEPFPVATRDNSSGDFLGEQNLAGLSIESFFDEVANQIEKGELDDEETTSSSSNVDDVEVKPDSHEGSPQGVRKSMDDEDEDESDSSSENESENDAAGKSGSSTSSASDDNDSDADSGSDDDDVEAAEARMKREMAKMKQADPTFHKFLKENEESLLDFGGEEDGDEDDESESELPNHEHEDDAPTKNGYNDATTITPKVLKALLQGAFKSKGIRGLKKLVGAYKSACHMADATPEDETSNARPGESGKSYTIESSKVFDQLMVKCLNHCHESFRYHLLGDESNNDKSNAENEAVDDEDQNLTDKKDEDPKELEENKPINPKTLEKSDKWDDMKPIILSFFRSTLHVLSEAKEAELLSYILKALAKYVPFLSPFPRVASSALRTLVQLWSAPLESSEEYQVVRLQAFLRIRQLALTQPFPFMEDCMKKTYLAYVKRAKFAAASSVTVLPTITFMGNCLVELYSLDYHSAYQHAFVYVRQLALLLRSAMRKKTPETIQQVYSWQFVYSLKLWVAMLSSACQRDDGTSLRSLIYPLTEVIFGTCRLSPSQKYLPLRLQCVRFLQQLAAASETFIPTASILLECLEYKEWTSSNASTPKVQRGGKTSRGSVAMMPLIHYIKLPSTERQPCLKTMEQLEPSISDILTLIQYEMELYRYSPGYPEYAMGFQVSIKKFHKHIRQARWKSYARGCLDVIERYTSFAIQARSQLSQSPRDVTRLELLKALSQPSMYQRYQSRYDKELKASALLVQSAIASASSTESGKTKREASNDDKEEGESDDDDVQRSSKRPTKKQKMDTSQGKASPKLPSSSSASELANAEDEVREGVDWSSDEEDDDH